MSLMQTLLSFTGVLLILLIGVLIVCLSIYFVRKNPKRGAAILRTSLLLFMFFQYCDEMDKVFLPTQSISSFSDLSEGVEWPLELYNVEDSKEEFIEAVVAPGELPTLIRITSFRSGMPAYVFDLNGNLVDHTDDNLDDPRYQDKWYKADYSPRQQIAGNPFAKKVAKISSMEDIKNDAKKRDFVAQMISLVEAEQDALTDKGFNPTERLDGLKVKKQAADSAETEQQEAAARAQEATTQAHETLADAYKDASDFADVISGLLGKDNELVKKMRKFRK